MVDFHPHILQMQAVNINSIWSDPLFLDAWLDASYLVVCSRAPALDASYLIGCFGGLEHQPWIQCWCYLSWSNGGALATDLVQSLQTPASSGAPTPDGAEQRPAGKKRSDNPPIMGRHLLKQVIASVRQHLWGGSNKLLANKCSSGSL